MHYGVYISAAAKIIKFEYRDSETIIAAAFANHITVCLNADLYFPKFIKHSS